MRKFVLAPFNLAIHFTVGRVKFLTGIISRRTRQENTLFSSACVLDKTTSEWNITCVCVGGVKGGGGSALTGRRLRV
jgi:hypothetical protein